MTDVLISEKNHKILSYNEGEKVQHWGYLVVLITVIALILRTMVLVERTPFVPGGDEGEYIALAQHLYRFGEYKTTPLIQRAFQGGEPGDLTAFRTPGFPLLLSLHYYFFGDSQLYPRLTLIFLSSATCTLIAILGRLLFSPATGLLAALIWAFWPTSILSYYAADRLYSETVAVIIVVAHVLVIALMRRSPAIVLSIAAGILLGIGVLTRGYLIFLTPLSAVYIAYLLSPSKKYKQLSVIFLVTVSLVLSTWITRNWIVFGKPMFSTQTEQLYYGNNAWARGSINGDVFVLGLKSPQVQVLEKKYPTFRNMSEIERSSLWVHEGLHCIVSNPSRFGWLLCRKSLLFWLPFQDWTAGFYRWHYFFGLVLPFALIGAIWGWRQGYKKEILLLNLPVASTFLVVLITYSHDRFRYVIEPFVVIVAAFGAISCYKAFTNNRSLSKAKESEIAPKVA